MRWKIGVLFEIIAAILQFTALYPPPKSNHSLYVNYKRVVSLFFNELFYIGRVRTVCVCIAENALWKTGVLSLDIEAILECTGLYLHPKSSYALYVQYKWVSSLFFNELFYMGKVRLVCVCIAKNALWKTGVLSEDIPAILLRTALYMHPKSSRALCVQYKRVSNIL